MLSHNRLSGGSNPSRPTKNERSYAILLQNGIAAILYFPYNSLLNGLRIDARRFLYCWV